MLVTPNAALTKVPNWEATMAANEVTKKLHIYHTLYRLNLSFSNIVMYCSTLHEAGALTRQLAKRFQGYAQELQAEINSDLLEGMHQGELDDWARFGEVRTEYEKQIKDPDDVLMDAEERKQELNRQKGKK